jgi:hypothetical protein
LPDEIELIDPGVILAENPIFSFSATGSEIERSYWISGETESMSRMLDRFYERDSAHIEVISPEKVRATRE